MWRRNDKTWAIIILYIYVLSYAAQPYTTLWVIMFSSILYNFQEGGD